MTRYVLVVIMSALLTACVGNAPEKQRYQLPVMEMDSTVYDVSRAVILLQPVELSELLYQPGIVLQTDDITLHAANNHLWSSDLQQQITLGLQKRLQQRLPNYAILLNLPAGQDKNPQTLSIRIDAFQGHYDGYALTQSVWQLIGADNKLAFRAAVNLKTPLNTDGYDALVRALGKNLDLLADNIAKALNNKAVSTGKTEQ